MTDYIKLAKEAGYRFADELDGSLVNHGAWQRNQLSRFAELVAAEERRRFPVCVSKQEEVLRLALETLEYFAEALPVEKSTIKTCYGINNNHRDALHKTIAAIKDLK